MAWPFDDENNPFDAPFFRGETDPDVFQSVTNVAAGDAVVGMQVGHVSGASVITGSASVVAQDVHGATAVGDGESRFGFVERLVVDGRVYRNLRNVVVRDGVVTSNGEVVEPGESLTDAEREQIQRARERAAAQARRARQQAARAVEQAQRAARQARRWC
jgi:hypothetical protein